MHVRHERHWRAALNAFETSAAAWALSYKDARWRQESEIRMILKVREGQFAPFETMTRTDGSMRRFVSAPVTRLARMPVGDLIIGPNQDAEAGVHRAVALLRELEYWQPVCRVSRSTVSCIEQGCFNTSPTPSCFNK